MSTSLQLPLFSEAQSDIEIEVKKNRSGTFIDNMKLPVHRWFRYSAGFSAEWVQFTIDNYKRKNPLCILDPFAGSGTVLISAAASGQFSIGFDAHPFVYRIARSKLLWYLDAHTLLDCVNTVIQRAKKNISLTNCEDNPLLQKCFSKENLAKLGALREQYLELKKEDDPIWELVWLILTSILRPCSAVGTAQWQYILPNKKKSKVLDPFYAFTEKAKEFARDMVYAQQAGWKNTAKIILTDARELNIEEEGMVDLIITSPPYPNNYDYADATRLEMTFWGEISGWGDLQKVIRQYLIRSCSQHSAAEHLILDELLVDPLLDPIRNEITAICQELGRIRKDKGGKKTYHTMIAAYFKDLASVWYALRRLCKDGATACFVIGDSAPYGVYVPVDKWLGELALAAGFRKYEFEKIRDRNLKWKNRKHRVPLHEGRLWVEV